MICLERERAREEIREDFLFHVKPTPLKWEVTSLYSLTWHGLREVCRVYIFHSFDINVNTKTKLDGTLLLSRRLYFY